MSTITFENYGKLAENMRDFTQVAGRYSCQRDDEKNILQDVIQKLALSAKVDLLEVGCGSGNLLIPLSFCVGKVTGIDHPSCIDSLKKRYQAENVSLIGSNFLDCRENKLGVYHRILIYSVLHCLGKEEVKSFIAKAVSLLRPGGKMLLGDLPNLSKKNRFLASKEGELFIEEWNKRLAATGDDVQKVQLSEDSDTAEFNDDNILALIKEIRDSGCNAYLLPQPVHLPFGYTREDILVEKPV